MRKYMLALAALLTPALLSAPAYASELPDFVTPLGRVVFAIRDLKDVMDQVFSVIVSNPFLVVLISASLFTVGVRIFRKVKGVAKG